MAKDVALKTIGTIGHAGATYKAIEYYGKTIINMSMDERMAIANMSVEMGAKNGFMPVDDITFQYLSGIGITEYDMVTSDPDASYEEEFFFNAEELTPQVACPHEVDNVVNADSLGNIPIHQAYLGSCTGGRINDLERAAKLLAGKHIANGVRLLVSPASSKIWKKAEQSRLFDVLTDAGATILASTCGACVGLHSGLIASGENCLSSSNRNFIGRMGSKNGNIYLASPLTVAASALTGTITDPRNFISC
jgi:3-isopropylmalate/(R)-2-methylmalate dehydratase large subunit